MCALESEYRIVPRGDIIEEIMAPYAADPPEFAPGSPCVKRGILLHKLRTHKSAARENYIAGVIKKSSRKHEEKINKKQPFLVVFLRHTEIGSQLCRPPAHKNHNAPDFFVKKHLMIF